MVEILEDSARPVMATISTLLDFRIDISSDLHDFLSRRYCVRLHVTEENKCQHALSPHRETRSEHIASGCANRDFARSKFGFPICARPLSSRKRAGKPWPWQIAPTRGRTGLSSMRFLTGVVRQIRLNEAWRNLDRCGRQRLRWKASSSRHSSGPPFRKDGFGDHLRIHNRPNRRPAVSPSSCANGKQRVPLLAG